MTFSKSPVLKLSPYEWLGDLQLRLCSPGARGLLVDIICLTWPVGNAQLDTARLALLVGMPEPDCAKYVAELVRAKRVTEDLATGELAYQSALKDRVARRPKPPASTAPPNPEPAAPAVKRKPGRPRKIDKAHPLAPPPAPAPRPWWETAAGWARQAGQCALSPNPGEAYEAFQVRVAIRLPPGPHLDVLKDWQRAEVERRVPKMPGGG